MACSCGTGSPIQPKPKLRSRGSCTACTDHCAECCPDLGSGKDACKALIEYNERHVLEMACMIEDVNVCDPCILTSFLRRYIENTSCLFYNLIRQICPEDKKDDKPEKKAAESEYVASPDDFVEPEDTDE